MVNIIKNLSLAAGIAIIMTSLAFISGCSSEKFFAIGIINIGEIHIHVVEGFKDGMAELGYVEGKNVRYIYRPIDTGDNLLIDEEIKRLLSQDVDLLLAVANPTASRAKEAVKGTDTPVLAVACSKMLEIGLVKEMTKPEGNITGVIVAENYSKALEWLVIITPNAKKIYLPYNPADDVSLLTLDGLDEVASKIGVVLVLDEVNSVEEAASAIEKLPEDIDAIFRIPSTTLDTRNSELSQAAIKRRIPMGTAHPLDEDVMISFYSELYDIGKQSARLADQIHQGVKPSDLPVETADPFLTINLNTAEKIGINIPDSILVQAKKIIR